MTIPSLNGASTRTLLDGTLPVRPFHPDGFVGSLQALSLVGFDTIIVEATQAAVMDTALCAGQLG